MSSPQQRTIAHYRIAAKIGEGGMGEVYRATDMKLGREVAIKVIPPALASDADRMARLTREAQVLASLNHPNIASIYGVEDGALIMELIDGPTLDERIAQGPIDRAEARRIVDQVIDALEYAHERGIIHRDLKPSNIKITSEDRVKILDFGLAKALSSDQQPVNPMTSPTLTLRATAPGMILGTAAYMAPEQARAQDVDKRADIWAFGVIVYEMLTQRQLFAADTLSDTIAQVLTREFTFHGIPAEFEPLLERCLVRDRRLRLRDIGDARWLLHGKATLVMPSRRYSWPLLTALAAVAVIACVFGSLWWRSSSARHQLQVRFALDTGISPAIFSPDGRSILMASDSLRVRAIDSLEWRTLPSTEGARDPFWSADSSTIAFFADGKLKAVRADGQPAVTLAAAPLPTAGGSWRGGDKDGTVIFSSEGQLHAVDVRTGTVRHLPVRGEPGEILKEPVFLPEGDNFTYLAESPARTRLFRANAASEKGEKLLDTNRAAIFARHPRTGQWFMFHCDTTAGSCDLMVTPIDPRAGTPQGPTRPMLGAVAYYAARSTILLDVASNGLIAWRPRASSLSVWRMRWLDLHGNVVGSFGEQNSYTEIALSPDETRVATSQGNPVRSIWLFDVRTGTGARVSSLPGEERFPRWSPDGRVLYYVDRTDDETRIVAVRDGGRPEEIYTQKERSLILQQVTPDGDYLVFSRISKQLSGCGAYRLSLRREKGSEEPECIIRSKVPSIYARVTPEGKWIVYTGARTLLADRYPRPGPAPVVLDDKPGAPVFSRDGSTLYRTDGVGLVAQSVLATNENTFRLGEPKYLFSSLLGSQSAGAQIAVPRATARGFW